MSGSTFASDLFDGPPNTAISVYRAGWVAITGMTGTAALTASGTRLRTSGTAGFLLSDSPAPSPNYRVIGKYFITSTTSGPQLGISGRVSPNAATYYHARIVSGTGIQLVRYLNGSALTLATVPYSVAVNAEPVLALVMDVNQISVELNGVVVIPPVTDDTITEAGYIGVRALDNQTQLTLDEISAETLDTGGGSTTTTVSPTAAALVVAGYGPSITQTASRAVSPATASLIVAGHAPTVLQSSAKTIAPAPAALVARGYAPAIVQTITRAISPAPGRLMVTGYAPSIGRTGTLAISPGTGGLVVRGFAPAISQAANNTPQAYADTAMRISVTMRTVQLAAALNMQVPITRPSFADITGMRASSTNRAAGLDAGAINRIVSFP